MCCIGSVEPTIEFPAVAFRDGSRLGGEAIPDFPDQLEAMFRVELVDTQVVYGGCHV